MNRIVITILAALLIGPIACVEVEPKAKGWEITDPKEQRQTPQTDPCESDPEACLPPSQPPRVPREVPPEHEAELEGVFGGGHLGNYDSCPEEGVERHSDGDGAGPDGVSDDSAPVDCPDPDDCPGIHNCEVAQITVALRNPGAVVVEALEIEKLELFNSEREKVADLPILSVEAIEDNSHFPEAMEPGTEIMVRIEFRGPANPWSLLSTDALGDSSAPWGIADIHIKAANHPTVVVTAKPLYPISNIDT